MNSLSASVLVALAALLVQGCVALEVGDTNQLSPDASAKLEQRVPTLQESQLEQGNYIRTGSIDASLCGHGLIGTVTNNQVITMLRQKADAAGANGLTDVSCEPGPVDEISGCMSAIACEATMVRSMTPDTANK